MVHSIINIIDLTIITCSKRIHGDNETTPTLLTARANGYVELLKFTEVLSLQFTYIRLHVYHKVTLYFQLITDQ